MEPILPQVVFIGEAAALIAAIVVRSRTYQKTESRKYARILLIAAESVFAVLFVLMTYKSAGFGWPYAVGGLIASLLLLAAVLVSDKAGKTAAAAAPAVPEKKPEEAPKTVNGEVWNCPRCGAKNPVDAAVCGLCGSEKPIADRRQRRKCPLCGYENTETQQYCRNCGTRLF